MIHENLLHKIRQLLRLDFVLNQFKKSFINLVLNDTQSILSRFMVHG